MTYRLLFLEFLKKLPTSLLLKFLDREPVFTIIRRHFDGLENNSYKIWQLVFLHAWLECAWFEFDADFPQ